VRSIEELLSRLGALGIEISIDGEHLRVNAPKGALGADIKDELVQRKPEIIAYLAHEGLRDSLNWLGIPHVPRDGPLPLSYAQQRLWFLDKLEPGNSAYHVPTAYRLEGHLEVAVLERAIQEIVRRHEVLRTAFVSMDGDAVQIIAPAMRVPLTVADLRAWPADEREAEALRLAGEEVNTPFDLSKDPLIRIWLARLGDEEHVLVVTMHHIVSDGWSLGVFRRELSTLYTAFCRGKPSPLPELPVQYADYALWQHEWLQGGALARELAYWEERLEGAPELRLPTDRPRPALLTFSGARLAFTFPVGLRKALVDLSRRENVTLFMTLLTAFQVLLYRYSGQEDIVVGTPIANRDRAEIEGLIGFFANTLVLRTDLSSTDVGVPTFREALGRVREVCLGAYANQHLPFEKLVEELRPQRDPSRNPLFQVTFALQNAPRAAMEMVGLIVTPWALAQQRVRFDMECHLREEEEAIQGVLIYNTNLFDGATMERMARHYLNLLQGVVSDPQQRISELPLFGDAERRQLLVEWNKTETDYPRDTCVHQLFEAQAAQSPGAIAVVFGDRRLGYGELNRRANQLARYLRKEGVGPETLVGICMERSPELVTAMLAVLKAGGAYVPLDPSYPRERLAVMLEDARVPVLLTQEALLARLPVQDGQEICLDRDWQAIARERDDNLSTEVRADNLAYVMYTSGSTGIPKGICIVHRAVCRLVLNTNYIDLTPEDRVAQASNASFDAATFEIWGALLHGARLVGVAREVILSPHELAAQIRQQQISVLFLTTALFNQLASEAPSAFGPLRHLLFGGEACDPQKVRQVLMHDPPERLVHVYGPTESTTFATWRLVREVSEEATTVPIGRPISNSTAYVLDAHLQPAPIGAPGELYLGGDGLARGYLNNPALTAERFVASPFGGEKAGRLYRTGDRARYLPDGNIEFLGRIDDQAKIRGYRVEPKDVEVALAQHPIVHDCVVITREGTPGDKRLFAYVVVCEGQQANGSELRQFLRSKLPEYMVPSAFVFVGALPLTLSGKVDRQALPAPNQVRVEGEAGYVAPRTAIEENLVMIWQEVLGQERIGVEDGFFDLGGHSLLAVRLLARIERVFGERLPLAVFFQAPTIKQLAEMLGRTSRHIGPAVVPIQPHGSRPPIFLVPPMAADDDTMGAMYCYQALAKHLGSDQPVYGLQPKGIDGDGTPLFRIEEMAQRHVQQMRAIHPNGPYLVGGYSYGGLVAFEIARQLQLQHQDVQLVALFDTSAYLAARNTRGLTRTMILQRVVKHWAGRISKHVANLKLLTWSQKAGYAAERFRRIWRVIRRAPVPHSAPTVVGASWFAVNTYQPQAYSGKITLFRTVKSSPGSLDAETYGWGALAEGGVEVFPVPGDHWSLIHEPHVQVLAEALRACLDRIRPVNGKSTCLPNPK